MPVPAVRVRALNDRPVRSGGAFVLYWMTSFRRAAWNFALDRAVEHAAALGRPLVVLEALRAGYPHASERLHAFVLEGMAENARRFAKAPAHYFPYVEPAAGAGRGLVAALAKHACAVVTDDWPGFFVPKMQAAAAAAVDVRVEAVDSNGLLPLWQTQRVFTTAHSFRVHLQKTLKPHLLEAPAAKPFAGAKLPRLDPLPLPVTKRWPVAALDTSDAALAALPIDHTVKRGPLAGGSREAEARLDRFIARGLDAYAEARNEPESDGTSRLSPYLHFGHLSTHQVLDAIAKQQRWSPERLGRSLGGAKGGWWKLSASAEAFLDELVTWRELAFNMSSHRPDEYTEPGSLPAFARQTLETHARDARPHLYTLAQLESAQTHDALWNAVQRQLVRDGWFHGYLRMLWGKKILEWSPTPADALHRMDVLMSRYSLDGRDPVSWSGFMWVLGRYDRAWGPERPIFGKVRYMSSENTARKVRVKDYVARYGP